MYNVFRTLAHLWKKACLSRCRLFPPFLTHSRTDSQFLQGCTRCFHDRSQFPSAPATLTHLNNFSEPLPKSPPFATHIRPSLDLPTCVRVCVSYCVQFTRHGGRRKSGYHPRWLIAIEENSSPPPWSVSPDVFPMSEKHSSVKPPSLQTREQADLPRIWHGVGYFWGRGDVYSEIYPRRISFGERSRTANIPLLRKKANGSRDLTIVSRHSPSRHEMKATTKRERFAMRIETEAAHVSYIGKYEGNSSEDLQIRKQARERFSYMYE